MNSKSRNGQPGECGELGISELNRARRFSRFSWRTRFLALVVVFLSWMGGVRSAEAICTPYWNGSGINFDQTPLTPIAQWYLSHCYVYIPATEVYTPASSLTWTITSQASYFKENWECTNGGAVALGPPAISKDVFNGFYFTINCIWGGNMVTTLPTNALTFTGNGSFVGPSEISIYSQPYNTPLTGTTQGTFVAVPGSTITVASTAIGPGLLSGATYGTGQTATTSRAWTNTIPTSPGSSTVTSNFFPSTSSSGTFVPTYAGTLNVVSTNAAGTDASMYLNVPYAGQYQPYTLATKAFFANNSAAIGSLYSDGAVNYGTLLSSPTTGGGVGAAVDATGNVWSLASNGNSVTLFKDTGAVSTSYSGANLSGAKALAIDGNNRTWFANANSLTAMTNTGASVFTNAVGAGNVNTPTAMSVDNAGSLWVANSASNTVTEFIGLAAPVTVPTIAQVANVATGTLP